MSSHPASTAEQETQSLFSGQRGHHRGLLDHSGVFYGKRQVVSALHAWKHISWTGLTVVVLLENHFPYGAAG